MDVDQKDESLLEASKIASEMLDAPSPSLKRRGSTKRRNSVLLGLNQESDNDDVPSIASALNVNRLRRKSITPSDNEPEVEPSISAALNYARRGSTRARRKSLYLTNDEEQEESTGSLNTGNKDTGSGNELSNFKRRGSTYRASFKSKAHGAKPYPKRKGSFRRFADEIAQ